MKIWDKESIIEELLNEFGVDKSEDELQKFRDEIEKSFDLKHGSYSSWGKAGEVTVDGVEYNIIKDEDEAYEIAKKIVKEDLKSQPELFNQGFLSDYLYISNTDKSVMVSEEEDFIREGVEDNFDGNKREIEAEVEDEAEEMEFGDDEEKEKWVEDEVEKKGRG